MALAETAELAVKLTLGGNFLRQMGQVNKQLKTLDKESSRAYRAGQQIGTGIKRGLGIAAAAAGLLATQVALGLDSLIKLEQQTAQTEAVIASTGAVAGVTAQRVRELSEQYEALNATVGDETIQAAQNLLLTFTNIREDAFEPTLQAVLDMNQALGGGPEGLAGAAKLVGKALQDPEKGLSRLGRAVGGFSDQTVAAVKAALKQNDTLLAQNIILAELEKRYGGSFARAGKTTAGRVALFTDSIEDLQRALAKALLPAVGNIADALTELLSDPEIQRGVEDLGREIGNLFSKDNIKAGARVIGDVFNTLRSAAPAIKSALGTIGTVLRTAFDAFNSLPAPIQQLLIGGVVANKLTGGLVTNIAGGIFGALKAMTVQAGVVNVTGGIVNGGGGGVAGAAGKGGGALAGAAAFFPLAAVGALMVGAAGLVAEPVRQLTGVTAGGLGTVKAEVAGVKLVMGASQAAQAHANQINEERLAQLREAANRTKDDTVAASEKTTRAANETKREAGRGLSLVNNATRDGASRVASAVRQSRPIITTNIKVVLTAAGVSKSITTQERYGPGNGSSGGGGAAGHGGGG